MRSQALSLALWLALLSGPLFLVFEALGGGTMTPAPAPAAPVEPGSTVAPTQQPRVAPPRVPVTPVQPGPRAAPPPQPVVAPPPPMREPRLRPNVLGSDNVTLNLMYNKELQVIDANYQRRQQQLRNDYQRRREVLWEQLRQVNNREIDARNFKHYGQADAYQKEVIILRNALSKLESDYFLNSQRIRDDRERERDKINTLIRQLHY